MLMASVSQKGEEEGEDKGEKKENRGKTKKVDNCERGFVVFIFFPHAVFTFVGFSLDQ